MFITSYKTYNIKLSGRQFMHETTDGQKMHLTISSHCLVDPVHRWAIQVSQFMVNSIMSFTMSCILFGSYSH